MPALTERRGPEVSLRRVVARPFAVEAADIGVLVAVAADGTSSAPPRRARPLNYEKEGVLTLSTEAGSEPFVDDIDPTHDARSSDCLRRLEGIQTREDPNVLRCLGSRYALPLSCAVKGVRSRTPSFWKLDSQRSGNRIRIQLALGSGRVGVALKDGTSNTSTRVGRASGNSNHVSNPRRICATSSLLCAVDRQCESHYVICCAATAASRASRARYTAKAA